MFWCACVLQRQSAWLFYNLRESLMGADMQYMKPTGTEPIRLKSIGADAAADGGWDEPKRWYQQRWLWIGAAVLALGVGTAMMLRDGKPEAAAPTAAEKKKQDMAKVRVIVPGQSQVAAEIAITGTLAAKNEMPIGPEAEGGRVIAVLADVGQRVAAGQPLVRIDTAVMEANMRQMQASVEEARASARLAKADLDRALPVAESGALSRAELDRRKAAVDTSAARVKVVEAQNAEMRARLDRMVIRAPAAGLVLERHVELGQTVNASSPPLFKLAKGSEVELRGQVAEQDLPQIKLGQPVRVSIAGVNNQWTGRVWQLGATIDAQSRLGSVRIDLPQDAMLRPGAFARATIEAATVQRPVLPQSAVLADNQGAYVYVVDADNKVVRKAVRIGTSLTNGVTILEGLTGSETIVVSSGPFLQVGEQISPVKTDPKTLQ
jgi:HlyD family secretion protein